MEITMKKGKSIFDSIKSSFEDEGKWKPVGTYQVFTKRQTDGTDKAFMFDTRTGEISELNNV